MVEGFCPGVVVPRARPPETNSEFVSGNDPVVVERKKRQTKEEGVCCSDPLLADSGVKAVLRERIGSLQSLEEEISLLAEGEGALAKERLARLRMRARDAYWASELFLYVLRTSGILKRYAEAGGTSGSFVGSPRETTEAEKLAFVFFSVAGEHAVLEGLEAPPSSLRCSSCGCGDLRRAEEGETTFVCFGCSSEVDVLDESPSFKDSDRVNMSSRFSYSRRGHFANSIKKYQGRQALDDEVVEKVKGILLEEMKFHDLTSETFTKEHARMFLLESGLSSHYDDVNLFHHLLTGKPCPDVSSFEDSLMDAFDDQEAALQEVLNRGKARVNSLNVYYKLFKLLQRCGHGCKREDFFVLRTKAREDEHDEKMKEAWSLLGWEWIESV